MDFSLVGNVGDMSPTCQKMSVLSGNFKKKVSLLVVGLTRIREMCTWGIPEDDPEKKIKHFLLFSGFLSSL